jgi:hypothetical protein
MTAFEFILYAIIIQYIARIFTHDWVEIGFQGKLLREEYRTGKPSAWIKIVLCLLLTGAITYFFTFSKQTYSFMTPDSKSGRSHISFSPPATIILDAMSTISRAQRSGEN